MEKCPKVKCVGQVQGPAERPVWTKQWVRRRMVGERFRGPAGAVSCRALWASIKVLDLLWWVEGLGKVLKKGTLHNFNFLKIHLAAEPGIIYSSGPQPFWRQGPVSWKTIFLETRVGWGVGWFQDASRALHSLCTLFLLLHHLHLRSSVITAQRVSTPAL